MAARRGRPGTLLLLLMMAILAGCGDQVTDGPVASQPSGSDPGSPSPSDGTALTVVIDDGEGKRTTWTVTCDPAGGDHPDPAAACRALAQHGAEALPAVPPDRVCSQQFAGPQTAALSGTWRGEAVDSRFSLRNGCEIARWKALTGLLPAAGS